MTQAGTAQAKYVVFKRTCRNWEQFSSARKFRIWSGLTYEEARQLCDEFNNNRTSQQKRAGTKYEFTAQENFG